MLHDTIFTAIKIGGLSISIYNLIIAMIVFSSIAMIEVAFLSYFLFRKKKAHILYIDKTKINFINLLFRLIALMIALLILNINFTHLMILFGSLSLGAGFGLQFIIENFFSGLLIIIKKDFLVGDNIKIINITTGGSIFEGKIKHIYSLDSTLIDIDHKEVMLPNSALYKNGVMKCAPSSKPQS
jgi:small-conductance mechanosensitive channel